MILVPKNDAKITFNKMLTTTKMAKIKICAFTIPNELSTIK